jgi:protein transport protein SEC23
MELLRDSLQMSLNLLPENASIGLIIFGTTVQVYELGFGECSKAYVFRGDRTPTNEQIQDQLGLTQKTQTGVQIQQNPAAQVTSRFIPPLSECEVTLSTILEELQCDPWPVKPGTRSKRCTGTALAVATSLLESAYPGFGGRILMFMGGPCTLGEGAVVGLELTEQMRMHNELRNDTAKHYKKASKYYQGITQRLVKNGHTVDVFAANLDQVGVLEMKSCCENTGGAMVLTDTFDNPIYKESLKRFFKRTNDQLTMAFNAYIDVQTSREMRVCGALGPVTSMNKKTALVADTEIGYGGTTAWKINALTPGTTIAIYFDGAPQAEGVAAPNPMPLRYFQFTTAYQHSSGQYRLRVTTRALKYSEQNNWGEIAQGFDQEAAAVLVARLAIFKAESEYLFDVLRWLDRLLIRVVAKFGEYQKDNPNSLNLPPNFTLFPQFMYHLRRSQFLRVFNSSPDETTFFRLTLNRENTTNSIIMIQPSLTSYSFTEPPHPVLLDSLSVKPDNILLLDTFFQVLIHYGETIAAWRDAGYHNQPKYENFKKLLEIPKEDAKVLMQDRFPYPRYVEADQYSSQARILSAKINPSTTHHTQGYGGPQGSQEQFKVLTDDASLQVFMDHLKKLAVAQ